jgi:hypothetical protein
MATHPEQKRELGPVTRISIEIIGPVDLSPCDVQLYWVNLEPLDVLRIQWIDAE